MLITKSLLSVSKIASDDPTRVIIQSVQIKQAGDTITAEATDGRACLTVSQKSQDPSKYPSIPGFTPPPAALDNGLLPTDAIKEILKALPKKTNLPILNSAQVFFTQEKGQDPKGVYALTDLQNSKIGNFRPDPGNFPIFSNVIPKESLVQLTVNFDVEQLLKTVNALKAIGCVTFTMGFTPGENGKAVNPILIKSRIASVDPVEVLGALIPAKPEVK